MGKVNRTIGILIAVFFLVSGVSAIYAYNAGFKPVSSASSKVTVEIKNGMSTWQIAGLLESRNIIRSKNAFIFLAKYHGKTEQLKAGVYELDRSQTLSQILDSLLYGKIKLLRVTIPEGLTIRQTAQVISKAGLSDAQALVDAAGDAELTKSFGISGRDAEGYLMPETYYFPEGAEAMDIIAKMLATFFEKVEPLRRKYQPKATLEFKDVVTMASIIEKETASMEEYPLISAVFHSRLKKGMRLQADPTVIYGLPNFDGNLRKKDLMYDSPYNTYRYAGLPPGPIASPGLSAIKAVYEPENSDYLYFVAIGENGRHYFSRTLVEHNRAVAKYQLNKRRGGRNF